MINTEIPIKQFHKFLENYDTENMDDEDFQQLVNQFIKEYTEK